MTEENQSSEYLVISRGQWDSNLSQEEIQTAIEAFYVWHEGMVDAGKMKAGQRLARDGKTVSKHTITDGPSRKPRRSSAATGSSSQAASRKPRILPREIHVSLAG